MTMLLASLALCAILTGTSAQLPPKPAGVTWLKSKFHDNVTISYKETNICETTPGVKGYAGYVHLPPRTLDDSGGEAQNYSISTFFWFFEARKAPENAPLAIWLNGGPGASSLMGLFEENGPCLINSDSKSTRLNPWSWNNEVNMLYLDQPNQVGFSYDIPTNGTSSISDSEWGGFVTTPTDFTDGVPAANASFRVGTYSSQDPRRTANSTEHAAHALWHFAQNWFFEFPHYKPIDDRISLWAESYGGHYGPAFLRFFQEQNEKITNGSSTEQGAQYLHVDTLGIVNGYIDIAIQGEAYITFAYNNTYGIQVFNQSYYEELMYNWTRPDGCKAQVIACQEALKHAKNKAPDACVNVSDECKDTSEPYRRFDHSWFDIAHPWHDPFPTPNLYGYLTESSVLSAIGVPVNFTSSSTAVEHDFDRSLDRVVGYTDAVAYLLDSGVKVHMMYGDRDYTCNWVGGEAVSLAVPYARQDDFAAAGYAPLVTPDGVSGMTRQFGNYSFTRVFQSGHEVPAYQPAAAYEIFMRATFGRDVPTGLVPVTDEFRTVGPKDVWSIKNVPPEWPKPRCYVLKPETCTPEVWAKVESGEAVVKDWYVVEEAEGDTAGGQPDEDYQQVIGEL